MIDRTGFAGPPRGFPHTRVTVYTFSHEYLKQPVMCSDKYR